MFPRVKKYVYNYKLVSFYGLLFFQTVRSAHHANLKVLESLDFGKK